MAQDDERITSIAEKNGVGPDAVKAALTALRRGNGTMAQFSHPDFGGMAQWSKGGMSMVGDMFNSGMKASLDGVMSDLGAALDKGELASGETDSGSSKQASSSKQGASSHQNGSGAEWPSEFGKPSSSGSQNDMRYAFFPDAQRLVIEDGHSRKVYDTGAHRISGVSQQQSTSRDLSFTSQDGPVRLDDLRVVS